MENVNEKKLFSDFKSRCFYCNSLSYGKGCNFAPHGVHVHMDDPKRCAYCKSLSYGRGCKMNPTSDLHVHGVDYRMVLGEQIESYIYNIVLLNELFKDNTETLAYQNGLINTQGNVVREPINEKERAMLSPAMRTIFKIKRGLGSKLELMRLQNINEKSSEYCKSRESLEAQLKYKKRIGDIINNLHEAISDASNEGLEFEQIEAILRV